MSQSTNFSELRDKIDNWDIEAEEMLLRKIQAFTNNYMEQYNQFSKNLDSLDIHIVNSEVESNKAISQLKILANNQFMEEILEENPEQTTDETKTEISEMTNPAQIKEITINDIESQKESLNISIQALQSIQSKKDKDKIQIEDDNVSVSSSKLNLDNFKKNIRLPYIIGTEEFNNDKVLGLTIKIEEDEEEENKKKQENNDSEDEDVKEFLSDIKVDDERRKKWEKVKKKKKKKKEKELLRENERIKESENNFEFEEDKVKVPIENEEEATNEIKKEIGKEYEIIENTNISNNAQVPVPPPKLEVPPPEQPKNETIISNVNNEVVNSNNNNEIKNNIIQPKIENINNEINIQSKIENNNNGIVNQNPKDINTIGKKQAFNAKLGNIFGGVDIFQDDEDDDMDDGLFSRKNRKIPVIPNQLPNQNNNMQFQQPIQPQIQMPHMGGPMLQMPHMSPMTQMPQMAPNQNISSQLEIKPKINKDLGIAKKKLNNMFEDSSDDDDDDLKFKPKNLENKNKEINLNNPIKLEEKKIEIKEEKKEIISLKKEEILPVKKEEILSIKKEEIKPVKKEEILPVKKEEILPIKKEEIKPIEKEEIKPVEKEEIKPVKIEEIKHEKKEEIIEEKKEINNNDFKAKLNLLMRKSLIKKESAKEKMVNSLFALPEEENKNTNETQEVKEVTKEIKEVEKPKVVNNNKPSKKRLAFLFDEED